MEPEEGGEGSSRVSLLGIPAALIVVGRMAFLSPLSSLSLDFLFFFLLLATPPGLRDLSYLTMD